jgi:hypothetical protein
MLRGIHALSPDALMAADYMLHRFEVSFTFTNRIG